MSSSKPKKDIAWGIERDRKSFDFGKIVVGLRDVPILLWKTPGVVNASNLGGAVLHGQEVSVLGSKTVRGIRFYLCQCTVEHEGKDFEQSGYIHEALLKKRGQKYFNEQ